MRQLLRINRLGSLFASIFLAAICLFGSNSSNVNADLIDDFSAMGPGLSAYTQTRIFADGAGSNSWLWEIRTGDFPDTESRLEIQTTNYVNDEQVTLTRTDFSLDVGFELTADYVGNRPGLQDIGLYVGAGTPTADTREDFVVVYARDSGEVFSNAFDGTTETGESGGTSPTFDRLFITHTSANTFQMGYYNGATRNVIATQTITSGANVGASIGFYGEVAGNGRLGSMDNLNIDPFTAVPEPGSMVFLGLMTLGFVGSRRRR